MVSALTVLILGMWNPSLIQKKVNGRATGESDPKWLALAALGTGAGSALLLQYSKKQDTLRF